MTKADDHIQDNFERSAVPPQERKIDLHHLLELRKTARAAYWAIARDMRTPLPEDLDTLMPRTTLPKLVDGDVPYRYRDWLSDDKDAIGEVVCNTRAATEGQLLLRLIADLEESDPEFLVQYFEDMYRTDKINFIMALHVIGERQEIRDHLIKQLPHIDDFLLGIQDKKDLYLDNEYYSFDQNIFKVTREMASAYILKRAPVRNNLYDNLPDDEIEPFLQFARTYGVTEEALEYINTRTPLPKSLTHIHLQGGLGIVENLGNDIGLAQFLTRMFVEFDYLNNAEKLDAGRKYIEFLAKSYGVHPPPSLDVDDKVTSLGAHDRWDYEDKEECFAHPLGRILVPGLRETFTDYLDILSHEFTHSLEDAAVYSLNPEFQDWCKDHPGVVSLGDETMQKNFKSAALALSFNMACQRTAGLKGAKEAVYGHGAYYSRSQAKGDENDEKQKKNAALYSDQLRERHAYLYEYLIRREVERTLDKIEMCSDPMNIVVRAHEGMANIDAFIKETLLPAVPEEKRGEYIEVVAQIEAQFNRANALDLSDRERVLETGYAFADMSALIGRANGAGYIVMNENPSLKVLSLCLDISQYAAQATRIMDYNQATAERGTKLGHELQQAPA